MFQRHNFKAELVGRAVVVRDGITGDKVQVDFAGTTDNFTVTAYVRGVGYIGGWTCGVGPHPKRKKAPKWSHLVDSINQGIIFPDINCLPNSYGRQTTEQIMFRERGW